MAGALLTYYFESGGAAIVNPARQSYETGLQSGAYGRVCGSVSAALAA